MEGHNDTSNSTSRFNEPSPICGSVVKSWSRRATLVPFEILTDDGPKWFLVSLVLGSPRYAGRNSWGHDF